MDEIYDIETLELQISNYLSGDCTDEERQRLLAFLATDEAAAKTFREMSAVWALSSLPAFAKTENSNLLAIKEKTSGLTVNTPKERSHRKTLYWWISAAASVVLLLGLNYGWYSYTKNLTETYTNAEFAYEVKVPAGSRTNIILPDGTEVLLNSGSVLRYCRGFGIRDRKISLDGEGYFKVAKNKEIPFFVNVNEVVVKVVGTVFNVCGYNDDSYVLVSLLEGRVNLEASSRVMQLFPNEQVLYDKATGQMKKTKTNAAKACDWLDGGLIFENIPFAEIARRLERKFQMKISIASERLQKERFSGCFNGNQDIGDILREINVENQYKWRIIGNTIIITDRKEVK